MRRYTAMVGGVFGAVLGLTGVASGQVVLYDIDFEAPFHTVGQRPTSDGGDAVRRGPTGLLAGTPIVVQRPGAASQEVMFDGRHKSSGMQLLIGQGRGFPVRYPSYRMEFDLAHLPDAHSDSFWVTFHSTGAEPVEVGFRGDGSVEINCVMGVGAYTLGETVRVGIEVNWGAGTWSVDLDGRAISRGALDPAFGHLGQIRMSATSEEGAESAVFLDNIRVTGVPGVGTVGVLVMGGLTAARRRR